MKTVLELVRTATDYFKEMGIETARLDAELLLAEVMKKSRVELYCSYDQPVTIQETDRFREFVRRRKNLEPVAYILGRREFFGLDFAINPHVLVPRPDTETLVECALNWLTGRKGVTVADVGTGSGAIAIAVAKNHPDCSICATDNSEKALELALQNSRRHDVDSQVSWHCGDLFADLDCPFDLILSNPPYLSESDRAGLAADVEKYEPNQALFAGPNGLEFIDRLIPEATKRLKDGGALMIEVGAGQAQKVVNRIENRGVFGSVTTEKDLAGIERVVKAIDISGESHG